MDGWVGTIDGERSAADDDGDDPDEGSPFGKPSLICKNEGAESEEDTDAEGEMGYGENLSAKRRARRAEKGLKWVLMGIAGTGRFGRASVSAGLAAPAKAGRCSLEREK